MVLKLLRKAFHGWSAGNAFSIGVILLAYQIFAKIGWSRIPRVTAGVVALQVAAFLGWIRLGFYSSVCLDANAIRRSVSTEFPRFWSAPLTHASDLHLYYNVISFVWKGRKLESEYGPFKFFCLLNLFAVLNGFLFVGLSLLAADVLEDPSFLNQCAVGFSSILFSLKVVLHQHEANRRTWEDFGFFSVPKRLAIWTELLIIQILVPNASFIGHLAGVLAGLMYVNAGLPFNIAMAPYKTNLPASLITAIILIMVHFDVVSKPWTTQFFWSSKSSLVCLNSQFTINKGEWFRILSAPLEHQGHVHFLICLASFLVKANYLEKKVFKSFVSTIFAYFVLNLGTSLTYVALSQALGQWIHHESASECVQGLSGLLFALKTVTFFRAVRSKDFDYPTLVFELAESLILLEERNLMYHISGVTMGLTFCAVSPMSILASRFPGRGYKLGRGQRGPTNYMATRSWGYAGQEHRFRDGSARRDLHSVASPIISGDGFENQQDSESDTSSGVSTDSSVGGDQENFYPKPSAPPPPKNYYTDLGVVPPPPPPAGGTQFPDEDEEDEDPSVLDQVDNRSPSFINVDY